MNKKSFLMAIATLSIVFSGLNSLQASAWEIQPRAVESDDTDDNYDDMIELHDDETAETIPCDETLENCPEDIQEELENGTSDEPLVVCADKDEPDCLPDSDEAKEEVEESEDNSIVKEPAVWPMIVSFSVLGAAALVVIILNITGPKIK